MKKRSYKYFNQNDYLEAVKSISWWELYSCDDPEKAANIFTNKLNCVLDEVAPIRKFQVRSKYAPWLSSATKAMITERDLAQKKAVDTGDEEDWRSFKKLRNHINNKLKKERLQYQTRRLEACTTKHFTS